MNILGPRENGRYSAAKIFIFILLGENDRILIRIPQNCVPNDLIMSIIFSGSGLAQNRPKMTPFTDEYICRIRSEISLNSVGDKSRSEQKGGVGVATHR